MWLGGPALSQCEPQQAHGQPVDSEYRLMMVLNTLNNAPEDFREDKFLRAIRGR